MNHSELFDAIWNSIVEKTIDEFTKDYKGIIRFNAKSKRTAKRVFENEANIFLRSYMVNSTHNIDRHKIAACMLKAIVVSKPIKILLKEKISYVIKYIFSSKKVNNQSHDDIMLLNYKIAINVAVLILEAYINSDEKKSIKHIIYNPEPFPNGRKDYFRDICLDLFYTKPSKINTITYADVFFLLEKYSCRREQCANLESKLREYIIFTKQFLDVELKYDFSAENVDEYINCVKLNKTIKKED